MSIGRRLLFLFVLLPPLLFAVACSSSIDTQNTRQDLNPLPKDVRVESITGKFGGTLRYPMAGEPETFNPLAAREVRARSITYLTTSTLLEFDSVTQTVQPGVAESFDWLDEHRTLRIVLREGVKFSDGVDLTAEDISFTFERIYAPDSKNMLKDTLLIDGAEIEVRALNPLELEVEFPKTYAPGLFILTTIPILPKHCFDTATGPIEEYWTLDTVPEQMASLGPFRIENHEPGRRTTLGFNPHYWRADSAGQRLPYLDGIIFEYVEDRNTQILRLENGDLDLIEQVIRPEDLRLLEESTEVDTIDAGPSANLTFFWFNLGSSQMDSAAPAATDYKHEWFSDLKFRQAISCLISRETIIRNVFLGLASEASGVVSASNLNWFAKDIETFRYAPEQARALLTGAGFTWKQNGAEEVLMDSKGRPVEFELLTRSDEVLGKIAAIIQQDLAEVGIRVSIRQEELRAAIGRIMGTRDYEAALMNLEFPTEPTDIGNVLLSNGSMHIWNPVQETPATEWEAQIDAWMLQQVEVSIPAQRYDLFREVQKTLALQVPFVPLVNRNVLVAKRKQVAGLDVALVFPYSLSRAWKIYLTDGQ